MFSDLGSRIRYAVLLVLLVLPALLIPLAWVILLFVAWLVCLWELTNVSSASGQAEIKKSIFILGIIYFFGFSGLLIARSQEYGVSLVLLMMAGVVATDTAAYLGGRVLSGKFASSRPFPSISPNKTWEGLVCGFMGAQLVLVVFGKLLPGIDQAVGSESLYVIRIVVPVVAIAGDLFQSYVKRKALIKDFSSLLGAHGGLSDRVDALSAVFAGYAVFTLAGGAI